MLPFTPHSVKITGSDRKETVLAYSSAHPPQLSSTCGASSNPLAEITRYKVTKAHHVTWEYEHVYGLNEYKGEDYYCAIKAYTSPPNARPAILHIHIVIPG